MDNCDDPWDETPRCIYCGYQTGLGKEVVEIDSGKFAVGHKSELPYFAQLSDTPPQYIHPHCLLTTIDFTDACEGTECGICGSDLNLDSPLYRLRWGKMQNPGDTPFWQFESGEDADVIFACEECVLEGIGEGDHMMGCVRLGAA